MAKPINKVKKPSLQWDNIQLMSIAHIGALYGVWLAITSAKFYTVIFGIFHDLSQGIVMRNLINNNI